MTLHHAAEGALMEAGGSPPEGGFERAVLPHLSAGFTLARYLTGNTQDAEDAVQESVLRAMRYFHTLRDDDARPWFLTIVRRVCITAYSIDYPARMKSVSTDEPALQLVDDSDAPDMITHRALVRQRVRDAVDQLSPPLRETMVLRELQFCSYNEIAMIIDVPLGTVMSRLARGRERLASLLRDIVDVRDVV